MERLFRTVVWFTVSNALEKSKNFPQEYQPFSIPTFLSSLLPTLLSSLLYIVCNKEEMLVELNDLSESQIAYYRVCCTHQYI